jgi:hypothetical protein
MASILPAIPLVVITRFPPELFSSFWYATPSVSSALAAGVGSACHFASSHSFVLAHRVHTSTLRYDGVASLKHFQQRTDAQSMHTRVVRPCLLHGSGSVGCTLPPLTMYGTARWRAALASVRSFLTAFNTNTPGRCGAVAAVARDGDGCSCCARLFSLAIRAYSDAFSLSDSVV